MTGDCTGRPSAPQKDGLWPDASNPGVPLQPDIDGWHLIENDAAKWMASAKRWDFAALRLLRRPEQVAHWRYDGPLITESTARQRAAAAAGEMREACAAIALRHKAKIEVNEPLWHEGQDWAAQRINDAICALPLPTTGGEANRDALRWAQALQRIQQAAAAALEHAPDSELFALLHRTAAGALASDAEPVNEAGPACGDGGGEQ